MPKLRDQRPGKGSSSSSNNSIRKIPKRKWQKMLNSERDNISVLKADPPLYQYICQREFKCKSNIRYHDTCRTEKTDFNCDICGDCFKTIYQYESHMNTHSNKKQYKCPQCSKAFKHQTSLKRHRCNINESDYDDESSEDEGQTYRKNIKATATVKSESRTAKHETTKTEKQKIIQKSNWKYINSEDRDHIIIIPGEEPMYQCNECKKTFKSKYNIRQHDFCRSGEKPFNCNICGDSFVKTYNYGIHMLTHTDEKKFACPKPKCGKSFTQKGSLNRHIKSAH